MASRAGLSGLAVAEIAAGVLLAWSGIANQTIAATVTSLARGQKPAQGPAAPAGTVTGAAAAADLGAAGAAAGAGITPSPPSSAGVTALKAYAQALLAAHGWPGQFSAFNSIVEAESGWNSAARNGSGAYGIAQALGHGTAATAGSQANEYGNYGTSDAVCKAANSGSGAAQLEWMCNYIARAYGSPNAAWSFHLANGYY